MIITQTWVKTQIAWSFSNNQTYTFVIRWLVLMWSIMQSLILLQSEYHFQRDGGGRCSFLNMWRRSSWEEEAPWCRPSGGRCWVLEAAQVFAGVQPAPSQSGPAPHPAATCSAATQAWSYCLAPLTCIRIWLWKTGSTPTWTCSSATSCCSVGTARLWSLDAIRTPGPSVSCQPWGALESLWPVGGAVAGLFSTISVTLTWPFSPPRRRTTGRETWGSSRRACAELDHN